MGERRPRSLGDYPGSRILVGLVSWNLGFPSGNSEKFSRLPSKAEKNWIDLAEIMNKPTITIITVSYNAEAFIEQTIRSVTARVRQRRKTRSVRSSPTTMPPKTSTNSTYARGRIHIFGKPMAFGKYAAVKRPDVRCRGDETPHAQNGYK